MVSLSGIPSGYDNDKVEAVVQRAHGGYCILEKNAKFEKKIVLTPIKKIVLTPIKIVLAPIKKLYSHS